MKWFYQHKDWGLGNFIMATPALILLYNNSNNKVNVYFETKSIEELYQNCFFINILKKMPKEKYFSSSIKPNRLKHESDTMAYCRIICNINNLQNIPNTYIDNVFDNEFKNKLINKKYFAIAHGCLGSSWQNKKDIGIKNRNLIIEYLIENNCIPVLIGSAGDIDKYWRFNNLQKYGNNIINYLGKLSLKNSVSVLNACDFFISNDTGLSHVAGALNKKSLIIWNKTPLLKNKIHNKNINYFTEDLDNKNLILNKIDSIFFEKRDKN